MNKTKILLRKIGKNVKQSKKDIDDGRCYSFSSFLELLSDKKKPRFIKQKTA